MANQSAVAAQPRVPWTENLTPLPQIKLEHLVGEPSAFSYLIGNTRPLPCVLQAFKEGSRSLLLLGSGDLRVMLDVAARKVGSGNGTIDITLVDVNLAVVARNFLFLSIQRRLRTARANPQDCDNSCTNDRLLTMLWRVWYDTQLDEVDYAWLLDALRQAAEDASRDEVCRFARESDRAAVIAALHAWWLTPSSGAHRTKAMADRKQHIASFDGAFNSRTYDAHTDSLLIGVERNGTAGAGGKSGGLPPGCRAALRDELALYAEQGVSPSIPVSTNSSVEVAASTRGPLTHLNPTFFQPATGRFTGHHSMAPHLGYTPLETEAETEEFRALLVAHGSQPGALTTWCCRRLFAWATAWADGVGAKVRPCLCVGEAMRICAFELPRHSFDLVDTSNLVDHVGMPNLLACCGPLLRPSAASVLRTQSMKWRLRAGMGAGAGFEKWFEHVTGIPCSLTAAIFGLQCTLVASAGAEPGSAAASFAALAGASRAALAQSNVGAHADVQEWRLPLLSATDGSGNGDGFGAGHDSETGAAWVAPTRLDLLEASTEPPSPSTSRLDAAAAVKALTATGPASVLLASHSDGSTTITTALKSLAERCGMVEITPKDASEGLSTSLR